MRVDPAGPVSEQRHGIRPGGLHHPARASASGGSRYRASPDTPTGSRLVARTRTSSAAGSSAPHNSATAAITCSQLSSTSSICRRASTAASESATGTPGRSRMPSTAATADGTRAGSADRRQLHQPHPVSEPARHTPGHLTGQPGLTHPARPGHRHQPAVIQQASDLADRIRPADETRQRRRKTMHARCHATHSHHPRAKLIPR